MKGAGRDLPSQGLWLRGLVAGGLQRKVGWEMGVPYARKRNKGLAGKWSWILLKGLLGKQVSVSAFRQDTVV